MQKKLVYKIDDLDSSYNDQVGKKCANLGELANFGVRIPPGFALSVSACGQFMETSLAGYEIRDYLEKHSNGINKVKKQLEASLEIRKIIQSKEMPPDLCELIRDYYRVLCDFCGERDVAVAVRSSGAVSMPGQMDTFLNIRGIGNVINKIIQVWGSAFTARALTYRIENHHRLDSALIGVAVLKMVKARAAGVILTVSPTTGDLSKAVVEGNWGLGESVVNGEISPDRFVIDKKTGHIETFIGQKTKMVVYDHKGTRTSDVSPSLSERPCLSRQELCEIVRVAKKVEIHFSRPQDMEWVIAEDISFPDNLYWVQARSAKYTEKKLSQSEYLAELMGRVFEI